MEPPEWVSSSGRAFRFRCSTCGHSQMVAAPSSDGPVSVEEPSSESEGSIYLKQDGKVYLVQGWQTLSQWIEESRIGPEDLISEGGVRWEHVNERPEVAHLFASEVGPVVPVDADALPFDATPGPAPELASMTDAPARNDNRFGGVPTGLPPLPVLGAVDLGATASEAAPAPEDVSGENTPNDFQDELDVLSVAGDEIFEENIDDDELGDQGLTEELMLDETPMDELLTEEPSPKEESIDDPFGDPSQDVSTLDDEELFADFDSKQTAEPAPYSGDEWLEPKPASPWRLVVAVGVTLIALLAVGWWVWSNNAVGPTDDVELGSALTTAPELAVVPDGGMDLGTDNDSDVDSGSPEVDSDVGSGVENDSAAQIAAEGADVSVAAVEPTPEPVVATPEPVVAEPMSAPLTPRPAPAVRSVSTMIDVGWSKVDGGNLLGAAAEFQAALVARPGSGEANLGYGYVLVEQGRASQAVRYLCSARDNASGSTAAEARGILSRLELTCD
jgi:hypothetical protein